MMRTPLARRSWHSSSPTPPAADGQRGLSPLRRERGLDQVVRGHPLEHRRGGQLEVDPVGHGHHVGRRYDGGVGVARPFTLAHATRSPTAPRHAGPDRGHGAGALGPHDVRQAIRVGPVRW